MSEIYRGQVKSVNGEKITVAYGDGETGQLDLAQNPYGFTSPMVGMPVILLCPDGNIDQAIAFFAGYSGTFVPPSTDPELFHFKRGSEEVKVEAGKIFIKTSGEVIIDAATIKLGGEGASTPVMGNPKVLV